jgi:hypothetical protein
MLRFRNLIRWCHISGGLYLGIFLFSPLYEYPSALLAAQIVSVCLLLTGVGIWQWSGVTRALRGLGAE